ncbi:MAG: MoaD/ThiS family protein [Proteobacteria bacterium]|nr:MoaD/ThiS family protein [Pseudomonadota bacterium]
MGIIRGRRATEADSKHRFPVLESRPTETGGPGVNREMAISLYASVVINGQIEHVSHEFEAEGLGTVQDIFDTADSEKLLGRRFFKKLLGWWRRGSVTVLHNGQRLQIPKELKTAVADGDEINVLTPIVGG